jgi:hypothetical protein
MTRSGRAVLTGVRAQRCTLADASPGAHTERKHVCQRWNRVKGMRRAWALGALCLLAPSCGGLSLVPLAPLSGQANLAQGGFVEVRVVAVSRPSTVPNGFTPVHISIRNTGAEPVYVKLEDVQLTSPSGALVAVPPARVPPRRRVASLGMDPASPFVSLQSPGGAVGSRGGRSESVVHEPSPGAQFEPNVAGRDSPRAEILTSAFQEGAVGAGEIREGLVYFQHVPSDAGELRLRVGVRATRADGPVSVVELGYYARS